MSSNEQLIANYIKQAEAGDVRSALYLLDEFVKHADAAMRQVPKSEALVIDFIRRAVQQTLDGVPIKKAFCVASDGRLPSIAPSKDFSYFVQVGKAIARSGSIANAIRLVARKNHLSGATIKAAWNKHGGMAAWRGWQEESES
jgi:hypothetical protein